MDSVADPKNHVWRWWKGGEDVPANPPKPNPTESDELSEVDKLFEGVKNATSSFSSLLKHAEAPVPTQTGDGTALVHQPNDSLWHDFVVAIRDIQRQDIKTVEGLVETFKDAAFGRPMNDKNYLMESMVAAAAHTPKDFMQKDLTEVFIKTLWDDLQHPPQSLLDDKLRYRRPDGTLNSYLIPQIGGAYQPYARTVEPKTVQQACLPDPGVLFDSVMARKDPNGTKHPNAISSMLFYLASIIIHDVFKTDHKNYNQSNTSSYLDLAPLYGSDWPAQKKMRTFEDGKIHPDCFSETRLLTFPPGVGALLIMFNRYHNYVAEQLLLINEDGRFTPDRDPERRQIDRGYVDGNTTDEVDKVDDDLFQTARLITCSLYVNIILIDYVRTILNLNHTDSNWALDPRIPIKDGPPLGTGNQVSAEFNLVYRWHSAVSERDDKWTQQLFQEIPLPDDLKKPGVDISEGNNMHQFLKVLGKLEDESLQTNPWDRPFPALKEERIERIKEGPFKGNYQDDDLAKILTAGINDCANAMGPQQVPTIMKAIEVLGIQQARTWKCATLNEMRAHFNLTKHEDWSDITENEEVQNALKHLYDTPDQVELYPGLVVEDAKVPKNPGSGICLPFTTSRGVLSDAVALVRGDRFYTTSYTPASLTNWGFKEASSDTQIDNGCVFYKLFLRALPNNYNPSSIYVHYPMTVPDKMREIKESLGKAHLYDFDPPKPIPKPTLLFSAGAAVQVLSDQDTYRVTWGDAMKFLMGPSAGGFMLSGDSEANTKSRELMEKYMYLGGSSREKPTGGEKWLKAVREFYEKTTTKLLKQKSYKLGALNQVDIIRDVGNMAHVHFASELFALPLKTEDFPHGIYTENDMYLVMAAVFISVFFDLDPPKSFPLRQQAREATQQLGRLLKIQVEALKTTGKFDVWFKEHLNPQDSSLKEYGAHMLLKLVQAEPNVNKLVWGNIMGTAGGMVANQGQLFGQALDYLLSDDSQAGKDRLKDINRLAKEDTSEADDVLMHYLMEAARMNGETGVLRYLSKDATITDSNAAFTKTYNLKAGDRVMVALKAASRDEKRFPHPNEFRLDRDLESYLVLGYGPHQCFGLPMTRVALTTMLKVIGRLDGLRPARMAIGPRSVRSEVKKVLKEYDDYKEYDIPKEWHYHLYLTEYWDMYFPFPTSLKVNFDGDVSEAKVPEGQV